MDNVRLYSFFRSPSSWRVRIGLAWKGVPYQYVPVNLVQDGGEQWRPDYLARSPLGKVPLIEFTASGKLRRLTESMAILEYLEDRYPERPLLPRDPYLRGRSRMISEIINSAIQPMQNPSTLKMVKHELRGDELGWTAHWLTQGLAALEIAVHETAGRYCVGDSPSFADLFLVPQMDAARRFGVDVSRMPVLARIDAAASALPEFAAAVPERQPDSGSA